MMFWRKPMSESKPRTIATVVAMTMMPNISGISRRAMIRLPPNRIAWEAINAARLHAPADMARPRRLDDGTEPPEAIVSFPDLSAGKVSQPRSSGHTPPLQRMKAA